MIVNFKITFPLLVWALTFGVSSETILAANVDASLCNFLGKDSYVTTYFPKHLHYLCEKNGMLSLQSDPLAKQQGLLIEATERDNTTDILWGTYRKTAKSMNAVKEAIRLSCENFKRYRSLAKEGAFSDVEDVIHRSTQSNICKFTFVGKRFLFVKPAYDGEMKVAEEGEYFLAASRLTKAISDVSDQRSLFVAWAKGKEVEMVSIDWIEAEDYGLSSLTRNTLVEGCQKSTIDGFFHVLEAL
ncbi:MAG: hypothetical protein AB7T49_20485 [Oligoflexales bacterium]